jgi:hypothetical protein
VVSGSRDRRFAIGEEWVASDLGSTSSRIVEERRYMQIHCMAIERMQLSALASTPDAERLECVDAVRVALRC